MDNRIEEIKNALEAALPGRWERTGEGWFNAPDCAKIVVKDDWGQTYIASMYAGQHQEANAHLIANAPEWLRYLLEQNEQQQREIERLNGLLKVKEVHFNDGEVNEQEFAIQQLYIESKRVRDENEKLRREISSHGPEGRNYTNAQYVDLLLENERLKSVEHTLCLTIGEADKALQQSREENERLRGLYERERDIAEQAQRDNERLLGELEQKQAECERRYGYWHEALCELEQVKAERDLYKSNMEDADRQTDVWTKRFEATAAERDDYRKVLEWYGDGSEDGGEKARDIIDRYPEKGE